MFWKPTRNITSPSALFRKGSPTASIFGMCGPISHSSRRSFRPPLYPCCALCLSFDIRMPPLRGPSSFSATPGLVASLCASILSPIFYYVLSPRCCNSFLPFPCLLFFWLLLFFLFILLLIFLVLLRCLLCLFS